MNPDFIRTAHRRSVFAELQRLLVDRYVQQQDQPPREQIICEEVPFSQKEVSQQALYEVLNTLEELQDEERYQMSQFEMRRKNGPQGRRQKDPPQEPDEPVEPEPTAAPEGVAAGGEARTTG